MSALDLSGMEFPEWPEGYTPLEGIVVVKAMDPDGVMTLITRYSVGVTTWEALGMVEACSGSLRQDLIENFHADGDDGE